MRERVTAESIGSATKAAAKAAAACFIVRLPRMHFEVEQDRVTVTMSLDREASGHARPKCHHLCLSGIDSDFDVVAMQVNISATVGRPAEFDSLVLLDPDSLHIVDNSPVFDAQDQSGVARRRRFVPDNCR